MTVIEFHNLLSQVDIPWRYSHVEDGISIPFGIYTYERENALSADNKVYSIKHSAEVEVYAGSKATLDELCEELEEIFANNEIVWTPSERYSLDENFYLNTYKLEV